MGMGAAGKWKASPHPLIRENIVRGWQGYPVLEPAVAQAVALSVGVTQSHNDKTPVEGQFPLSRN